ncbi:MAG: hypothetical protein O3B13_22570 [Planctomycetota bacterium]|nr:hypothetical protein [Planctomycetota bacterium]
MKCFAFVLLAASLVAPCSVVACDTYTVTLVSFVKTKTFSVVKTKSALGADAENVRFIIDDVVQANKHRAKDDGEDFWRCDRNQTRQVAMRCLTDQPLGTAFVIDLEVLNDNDKTHIGKATATLQREDGELRLAFEMKHGERTWQLRRRGSIGGETFWVTRIFPADRSANYVLRFKIETTRTTK